LKLTTDGHKASRGLSATANVTDSDVSIFMMVGTLADGRVRFGTPRMGQSTSVCR